MAFCRNTESTANLAVVQAPETSVVFSSILMSHAVSELTWLCRGVSFLDVYVGENKPSHPTSTTFGGIVTAPCASLGGIHL